MKDKMVDRTHGNSVNREHHTTQHRLAVHTKWGIGLEVSAQTIYGVKRGTKEFNRRKGQLHQLRKEYGIIPIRVFDELYKAKRQTYNEDIPKEMITHAIDYYRWSDGSLQKRYHKRANMKWEGKPILMGLIVNVQTQKRYYMIWDDGKETAIRTAQLIQKALDNGEDIKYLVSDRLYNVTIEAIEKKGVTPVVYPKQKEAFKILKGKRRKVKGICYNYEAERQFTNISKTFYAIKERIDSLTWDEAKQLFESVLGIIYDKDDSKLIQWDKMIIAKAQRVTVKVPNPKPQPLKESN